ncbi:hypothetical protein [Flavobacterium sp. LHD-85]|uniref:hypothetical protein n=1 Tax=Flavobacterium sp. LHD-85 TaxID=3071410 RepID=UPI0027E0A994|nr:hypothetical protein [Flavobacterium sp. LHD-85]MDQ6528251.1 hypothetical protein [Flavobacterium sp. LHD-85]
MEELFLEEDRFQKHLNDNHYTLIAPVDLNLFEPFIKTINEIAPSSFFGSIDDALKNREAVRIAIQNFPPQTEYKVYVIISMGGMMLHATLEEYCERHNIQYP